MSIDLADVPLPPGFKEMIRAGALVAVDTGGGKDNQCMTILLSRISPRGQLVDVHASLGEIKWQRAIEQIEATLVPQRTRVQMLPFFIEHRCSLRRTGQSTRFCPCCDRQCSTPTHFAPVGAPLSVNRWTLRDHIRDDGL